MANTTIGFGLVLILLGAGSFLATGAVTSLIPAALGLLLAVCGFLARDPARRKLMMHIAVGVGMIGFLGSARGLAKIGAVLAGEHVERANAVVAQSVMAVLCIIFVGLCVRSFVEARRAR